MARILVVDDKELMRDGVATMLSRKGHSVVAASDARMALTRIAEKRPDCVVTDLQMPTMSGLELLEEIRKFDPELPIVLMTAFGTVATAVEAMRKGAFDYVTKPFSGDELTMSVEKALEHGALAKENAVLKASLPREGSKAPVHRMVGSGPAMQTLRTLLKPIAESHGTVMVTGESGTGKEVAARALHEASPRSTQPFLALNCAALSAALLESELFGHEKGAFTGADRLRKGRFELADGGTLLLDEISEIPPELQAKLLRVLQEKSFERVGSSTPQKVDVRIIATTNRDLAKEVDAGRFRGDLYFRLNVLPLRMPALREHTEDIAELAEHFLKLVASREGGKVKRLSADALALFAQYPWPGNVRELQNLCERAAVLSSGEEISGELVESWLTLPAFVSNAFSGTVAPGGGLGLPLASSAGRGETLVETMPIRLHAPASQNGHVASSEPNTLIVCDGRLTLDEIERRAIVATLEKHRGHRQRSAVALGIGVRTLGLKLKKWKEEALVPQSL